MHCCVATSILPRVKQIWAHQKPRLTVGGHSPPITGVWRSSPAVDTAISAVAGFVGDFACAWQSDVVVHFRPPDNACRRRIHFIPKTLELFARHRERQPGDQQFRKVILQITDRASSQFDLFRQCDRRSRGYDRISRRRFRLTTFAGMWRRRMLPRPYSTRTAVRKRRPLRPLPT